MVAGLPPPALPSLYASCVRAAGLTAGAPTGSTWWISPGGTGNCTGWRWGPTRRSISWTTWKSTVTSRVERPVPLLLRSLPVHSSPVGIFFFFHGIWSPPYPVFRRLVSRPPSSIIFFSFHTAINGLSYFYTQSRQYREESRALAGLPFVISFAGIDYLCLYMTITDKVFPHTFTLFFFAA